MDWTPLAAVLSSTYASAQKGGTGNGDRPTRGTSVDQSRNQEATAPRALTKAHVVLEMGRAAAAS